MSISTAITELAVPVLKVEAWLLTAHHLWVETSSHATKLIHMASRKVIKSKLASRIW